MCGRRSTESLLKELRRGLAPQWPRLLVAWQAQYREPPEGAAARIGAAVAAAVCCAAGAVQAAVILAFAEEVSTRQICLSAVILVLAEEVSL